MPNREVVLSAPLRTAIGTFGGALKETTATELGATAVRAVLARSKIDHVAEMDKALQFPGVSNAWTMPVKALSSVLVVPDEQASVSSTDQGAGT
jgi:acetyl-CoA acetyltransferase